MLHHKKISRFWLEGIIVDEASIQRLKTEYILLLVSEMRTKGYVMRTDIDIDFTVSYLGEGEGFVFMLSVYGVYVGRKQAQEIDSLYGYKPIYREPTKKVDNVF